MAEIAGSISRRERGKDARRTRIVDAACALTREVAMADISVKMIADRADVSPATVYNLFGAKGAVIAKVYERDLLLFERRVLETPSADPLEAMFDAASIACDLYRADPSFYRAILSVRDAGLDRDMVLATYLARVAFWRKMVVAAAAAGLLVPDASPERLGVLIIQVSTGALSRWVVNIVDIDTFEQESRFGLAACLLPFATDRGRAILQARLREAEAALAAPRLKELPAS